MRALLFCVLTASLAWSQTAVYPGAVATDNQLKVAANNVQTTITFPVATSDTTIQVASSTGIVANSIVTIDNEIMAVCAVPDGTHLTIGQTSCPNTNGRGFDSSVVATHSATGANCNPGTASGCVSLFIDAWHHNAARVEIEAVESTLGAGFSIPVTVPKGGTGDTTATAHGVAVGEGTSPLNFTSAGTSGQPLVSGGASADPTYQTLTVPGGGSGLITATAHGVLLGEGASPFGVTGAGTAGQVLTSTGPSADPTFQTPTTFPAGLQTQILQLQSNVGNNTTTQFAYLPFFNAANYTFPAYSCNVSLVCSQGGTSAGTIVAGNNTLTFTPVPLGMNGSDLYHRVYFSNGTGGAEGCLINGGTGTSGQASGQIIVNCVNGHTGAYTITPTVGGLQEAVQAAVTAGGGYILAPPGIYSAGSALQIQSGIVLAGVIGQTIIKPLNSVLARNAQWQNGNQAGLFFCVVCVVSGAANVVVRDLTIDENGPNQTYSYFSGDLESFDTNNGTFENVTVQNRMTGGTGVGIGVYVDGTNVTSAKNNKIINSTIDAHLSGCTVPNGGGGYYIEGEGTRLVSSFVKDICDDGVVVNLCDHCVVADTVVDIGLGQMATPSYGVEGATYTEFNGAQCIATGTNGARYCVGVDSTTQVQTFGTKLVGVSCSHCSNVLEIGALTNSTFGATTPSVDTDIEGIHADNVALDCIDISNYAQKVTIIGGDLEACTSAGINVTSTGSGVGTTVTDVYIDGIKIDHAGTSAFISTNNTTGPPVIGLRITNSKLGDSYASPRTLHGITLSPGVFSDVYIAGNSMVGTTGSGIQYNNTWGTNVVVGPNTTGDSASMITQTLLGTAVASAATITATGPVFHVTGTTAIATINVIGAGVIAGAATCITIIPDGIFTTTTAGNIALASTAVVSKQLIMCHDSTTNKWYPSY